MATRAEIQMNQIRQPWRSVTGCRLRAPRLLCAAGVLLAQGFLVTSLAEAASPSSRDDFKFHDSHFHLTNYVQERTPMADLVDMMGDTIGRSTVFGLPLRQM
jgi:hypothetical protein